MSVKMTPREEKGARGEGAGGRRPPALLGSDAVEDLPSASGMPSLSKCEGERGEGEEGKGLPLAVCCPHELSYVVFISYLRARRPRWDSASTRRLRGGRKEGRGRGGENTDRLALHLV